MASRRAIAALSLLAATASAAPAPAPSSTIQWQACNQTEFTEAGVSVDGITFDCTTLPVPLDYTKQFSNESLPLQLVRVHATATPVNGSILMNFGGPGLPARHDLVGSSSLIQALTGGAYNLIAFDPRGTGVTIPYSCSKSAAEAATFIPKFTTSNSSDTALGHIWASSGINARACVRNANATGRFLSSAFVARDLMSVVDALGEDGKLRFWGLSYGTTLGATVVSMFPDRMDKVILDGVQNPYQYYNYPAYVEQWADGDATFEQVFIWCLKTPAKCPLVKYNQTAQQLTQRAFAALDDLKYNPVPVLESIVLDQDLVQPFMVGWIKSVSQWPNIVGIFDALFSKNTTELNVLITSLLASAGDVAMGVTSLDPLFGISCSDSSVRSAELAAMVPFVKEEQASSRFMGILGANNRFVCTQWGLPGAETAADKFRGNYRVKPSGKVIVAGNTWDAHTSFRSARNLSATIEGSGLFEVRGHGHTTIASASLCSYKAYNAFWMNGTYPNPSKPCCVEGTPFSGITWANVFAAAAGNSSALPSKRSQPVKEYRLPSYLQ